MATSMSSASLYGSSTNKGFGGLVSGLDTDDLVKQMTARTRNKINRQYQAKQKLLYKQEAYRSISSKLLEFSNKYFLSSATSNVLNASFFKANTFDSSSQYVSVSGNVDNIKNFSITDITSVATAASFTSSKIVSEHTISSSEFTAYTSSLAGETMSIEYGGKTYNLTIDKDFGKILKDADGNIRTGESAKVTLQDVAEQLNKQLATLKDNNGALINENNSLIKYKIDDTGKQIVFDMTEGRKTAKLTAGSTKLLETLNLKTGQIAQSTAGVTKSLTAEMKDILSNPDAYMTFDYNGVQKTIKLNSTTTDGLSLKDYLQSELNKAYGSGKVEVDFADNKITFKTIGATSSTDLFGVSGISNELSCFTGVETSTYNRVNQYSAIGETNLVTSPVSEKFDGIDGYSLSVNGEVFKFEKTATLSDIMKTINSNVDAGVNIYYSSTTDTFTVKSTITGSNSGVEIKDLKGNLAESLFGTEGVQGQDYTSIDKFLTDNLKTGETYKFNEVSKEYEIYDNTGKIGTATIGADNKVKLTFTPDNDSRSTEVTLKYIINKGTDTEMKYKLNGVETTVSRSTANFSIDGININLNEKAVGVASSGTPITFSVTSNTKEVVDRVKQFITDYNELVTLMNTKTSEKPNREYQPLTPEQSEEMEKNEIENWTKEAKKGILFGDSKINDVLNSFRSAMSVKTSVSSITLSDMGISAARMDTTGKLTFDEEKFKSRLAENSDEIVDLFMGTSTDKNAISGIAVQIQTILKKNIGNYGSTGILVEEAGMDNSITSDKNFISERISEYDDKMSELKKALTKERQRYWNKFTALERTMSNLNSQSSWLTSNMGS